jgi:hypothetical protein
MDLSTTQSLDEGMTQQDLLGRAKPLADPVFVFTTIGWLVVVCLLGAGLATGNWFMGASAWSLLGVLLLTSPGGNVNAIYLRAFATDELPADDRAEIAAILGPRFRLGGIRPPRERMSSFRFVFIGYFVYKYAGSKHFELEAGADWIARLWKTYETTRLVFIDVRNMTAHVHQEIDMTIQTMGSSRVVFLVNGAQSEAESRSVLKEIVGVAAELNQLQILDVSPAAFSSGKLDADVKQIVRNLPGGVPGRQERGRHFVLDHVTVQEFKEGASYWKKAVIAVVVVLLSMGVMVAAQLLLLPFEFGRQFFGELLGTFGALMMISKANNVRIWANRLRRAGHREAAAKASFIFALTIVLFVIPLLALALLPSADLALLLHLT